MSRTSDSRHGFGREACGDGEEPLWWRRLEENGVRFQRKALTMGIGSDAKVASPDHVVGGKGKHMTFGGGKGSTDTSLGLHETKQGSD